jgi:hypothetical protein
MAPVTANLCLLAALLGGWIYLERLLCVSQLPQLVMGCQWHMVGGLMSCIAGSQGCIRAVGDAYVTQHHMPTMLNDAYLMLGRA